MSDLPGKIPTLKGKPTPAYLRACLELGFAWAQLERASASERTDPEAVEAHRAAFNLYAQATTNLRAMLHLPNVIEPPRIIQ